MPTVKTPKFIPELGASPTKRAIYAALNYLYKPDASSLLNFGTPIGVVGKSAESIFSALMKTKPTLRVIQRAELEILRDAGYELKPAGLYQSPGASIAHKNWTMGIVSKPGDPVLRRPFVITPPVKK